MWCMRCMRSMRCRVLSPARHAVCDYQSRYDGDTSPPVLAALHHARHHCRCRARLVLLAHHTSTQYGHTPVLHNFSLKLGSVAVEERDQDMETAVNSCWSMTVGPNQTIASYLQCQTMPVMP